jgi:hypothetical protein
MLKSCLKKTAFFEKKKKPLQPLESQRSLKNQPVLNYFKF